MKCICDRAALNEALAATSSVIATRTPKPILQCVRLTADADVLTLTSYDQEVGIRYRVKEVEVNQKGETLVMGERLAGIVRESADETLALEFKEDQLHIRGQDSHFQIYSQDVREFPPVADLEGDPDFTIEVGPLRQIIERTVFAAARENTRYAINGVLWERKGNKLRLIATDGRRLALSGASLEKGRGGDAEAIVPLKALQVLLRMHMDPEERMAVRLTSNQIILRTDRATINSVLVEGRFPNFNDVIPRDFDKRVEIPRDDLLSAVKRAALLTNEESKGIRMALSGEGLVLSSRAPQQGEATVRVAVEYKGEPMEIGFNPVFLIDALKVCDDTVTMELLTSTKPGVMKSKPDFLYVVMPVNLS